MNKILSHSWVAQAFVSITLVGALMYTLMTRQGYATFDTIQMASDFIAYIFTVALLSVPFVGVLMAGNAFGATYLKTKKQGLRLVVLWGLLVSAVFLAVWSVVLGK